MRLALTYMEDLPMRQLGALAALCALTLAGCGPAEGPKTPGEGGASAKKVVGAAMLTQTHIFFQDLVVAMEKEAQAQGLGLQVKYAEFDSRTQNNQIDIFIAQKVDAIIVSPTDSSGVAPVIAEARKKGIPVFTADIAAKDATNVICHVASDNFKAGQLVGEYLAKSIGGKGKVAIIDSPSVESAQERVRGFEEVMTKYPDIKIVQNLPGEGQRDKAMRACQDLLQAQPELNGIFGINDDSALGALAAVEAANLQDKIAIVGVDGTPEARQAILAGKALKADAAQFPAQIGKRTIEVVADYLLRGKTPPPKAPVEVTLLDAASLKGK